MALTSIVVGCDLSASSDIALERAVALAELHKAKIVLVNAQANDAPIAEVDNKMLEQLGEVSAAVRVEEARQLADRLAAIQARGVATDIVSRVGPADEILIAAADEYKAELIVLGSHGLTGISRLLLGSVAAGTIRSSTCDVLVCRGPATRAPFQRPLVATDFSAASSKALEHAAQICSPGVAIEIIHAWQLPAGSWGATLLGQARFPWSTVRDAVRWSDRVSVRSPDPVHLVAAGIVAVVSSAMAARKAEEGHGGHAGGSKNHAEGVEVHLSIVGE